MDYNNTSHPFHHHLLGFMSTLCLTQVVSEPTRLSSHSSTLIDLVLLSQPLLLISCHTVPPLANSDHHGIHLKLKTRKQNCNMHVSHRKVWRKVWRYTHADFPKTNYLLDELDLGHIFVLSDIDQTWINWREAFLSIIILDLCIPHVTLPTRKSLPWLTKTLINAMKKRNYYFRESKRSGDLHVFAKYKTLRNYIVMALCEAKQAFFASLQPTNKQFWGTLKQINNTKTTIPTLTMYLRLLQMLRRLTV